VYYYVINSSLLVAFHILVAAFVDLEEPHVAFNYTLHFRFAVPIEISKFQSNQNPNSNPIQIIDGKVEKAFPIFSINLTGMANENLLGTEPQGPHLFSFMTFTRFQKQTLLP